MMLNLLQQLKAGRVLLSDGATGTALQQRGLPPGVCMESWNETHSDDVQSVFTAYIAAGSDIIETNTFGGNPFKLAHYGLADKTEIFNRYGAEISRQAAGENHYVFGSVGPTGEFMQPLGTRSEAEMIAAFARQISALAQGGADAICIETQMALEEALAAVKAAKNHTNLPVAVTMAFDKTAAGDFRTVMGVSPEQMVDKLTAAGADVIGSNCGQGPARMVELCRKLRPLTDLPLMFQANAGLPVIENGQTVFKATPEEMAQGAVQLRAAGANIIGGCCGTTPEHIAAVRRVIPK